MATKAKTAGTATAAASESLEGLLTEALEQFNAKKYAEAAGIFSRIEQEASAHGKVGLARSARTYLAAMSTRQEKPAEAKVNAELAAQFHLNRKESDEALALLNEALKKDGGNGKLHYLKATALAQKELIEESAEALGAALKCDANLIHQFYLERDFDRVRNKAAFAGFELE